MTPTERFYVLCTVITVVGTAVTLGVGGLIKRWFAHYDRVYAERQQMMIDAAEERQETNLRHSQRNAEAITALANKVADNSRAMHERISANQEKLTTLYADMSGRLGRIEGALHVER